MIPGSCTHVRVTVFLVSMVTIIVEIVLMRELALRFWDHLAWLVISLALLGFGISGTLLVLLQRFSRVAIASLRYSSLLWLALSIPLCLYLSDKIELDLAQMVWQPVQLWRLGLLEILFTLPFICGGMYIGLALQDDPDRVPGHYGASFIGAGVGGVLVLTALTAFSPRLIMLGCASVIMIAALVNARDTMRRASWLCTVFLLAVIIWQLPHTTPISADKDLPQLQAMPDSEIVASRSGPQGLVHIVRAPAFHGAPGLSLSNTEPLPDQLLVTVDGHLVGSLYQNGSATDFAFLDNTTMALAYQLDNRTRVLISPEAGTARINLALYHNTEQITALADNHSIAGLKIGEMPAYIGRLYQHPDVSFVTGTLRTYLYGSKTPYSLIDLGITGSDFGGLTATASNALLTQETLRTSFNRLEETGALSITTHAHAPPRESLRLLNMLVELLQSEGRDPRDHIAIIRSWATVTLVATRTAITTGQGATIRSFCDSNSFDLVWLPDLQPAEVNRYHVLDEPQYYLGAVSLLGEKNSRFVARYIYDLTSPDDERPFFHHFSRSLGLQDYISQAGRHGLSYAEIGKLLLIAALGQTCFLAFAFIVLPMLPAVGLPGMRGEQLLVLGFFAAIGLGFMLLEMGFLQRLETFLGHPVYAASAVISGFLFFGGLGSIASSGLKNPLARQHCGLGFTIAALAILYLFFLDDLLTMAEGVILPIRLAIVIAVTGPPALLMGMMFPLGLRRLGLAQATLIPWAWSVNGFTSVLATLLAPLLAMHWGFGAVIWSAATCYALAALLSLGLPSVISGKV